MRLPVVLLPRKSRQARRVLVAMHVAAFIAAVAGLPAFAALPTGVAVAASLLWHLRRDVPSQILLKADGHCLVTDQSGRRRELTVLPATMVHRLLVTLVGRDDRGTMAILLPVDAVGQDGHRQLRVWLRWLALSDPV